MENNLSQSLNFSLPRKTLKKDSVKTVILASMVGTMIEFYDFYAYGTASAAYFQGSFFQKLPQRLPYY